MIFVLVHEYLVGYWYEYIAMAFGIFMRTLGMIVRYDYLKSSIGTWNFGKCIHVYTNQLKIYNIGIDGMTICCVMLEANIICFMIEWSIYVH